MNSVINHITRDGNYITNTHLILTDELLTQLYGNRYLCRQKLMNMIYLCENHFNLSDMNSVYYRTLSGPANFQMMDKIDQQLNNIGWKKAKSNKHDRLSCSYSRVDEWDDEGYSKVTMDHMWQEKAHEIRRFVKVMKPMNFEDTMMITTVYAAWNDLILSGIIFSDNDILRMIFDDWNMSYHQISKFSWRKTLAWLRSAQIMPRGNGNKTIPLKPKQN